MGNFLVQILMNSSNFFVIVPNIWVGDKSAMNPLITNAQPVNPYAAPMTLGTKLIAMDDLSLSPAQEVPVDVWASVLSVYHSYGMSVGHLPKLPEDGSQSILLKSKPRVLREIREKLDPGAYRVANYASAKDFKQADINLIMDRLPGMVERHVISKAPADALLLSARQCFDEENSAGIMTQEWKSEPIAMKLLVGVTVLANILCIVGMIGTFVGRELLHDESVVRNFGQLALYTMPSIIIAASLHIRGIGKRDCTTSSQSADS